MISRNQIKALRSVAKTGAAWSNVRRPRSVRSCIDRGWVLETGHEGRLALTIAGRDVLDAYHLGAG